MNSADTRTLSNDEHEMFAGFVFSSTTVTTTTKKKRNRRTTTSTTTTVSSTTCSRCHRPLTAPGSAARGMGPICAGKGSTGSSSVRSFVTFRDVFKEHFTAPKETVAEAEAGIAADRVRWEELEAEFRRLSLERDDAEKRGDAERGKRLTIRIWSILDEQNALGLDQAEDRLNRAKRWESKAAAMEMAGIDPAQTADLGQLIRSQLN